MDLQCLWDAQAIPLCRPQEPQELIRFRKGDLKIEINSLLKTDKFVSLACSSISIGQWVATHGQAIAKCLRQDLRAQHCLGKETCKKEGDVSIMDKVHFPDLHFLQ